MLFSNNKRHQSEVGAVYILPRFVLICSHIAVGAGSVLLSNHSTVTCFLVARAIIQ